MTEAGVSYWPGNHTGISVSGTTVLVDLPLTDARSADVVRAVTEGADVEVIVGLLTRSGSDPSDPDFALSHDDGENTRVVLRGAGVARLVSGERVEAKGFLVDGRVPSAGVERLLLGTEPLGPTYPAHPVPLPVSGWLLRRVEAVEDATGHLDPATPGSSPGVTPEPARGAGSDAIPLRDDDAPAPGRAATGESEEVERSPWAAIIAGVEPPMPEGEVTPVGERADAEPLLRREVTADPSTPRPGAWPLGRASTGSAEPGVSADRGPSDVAGAAAGFIDAVPFMTAPTTTHTPVGAGGWPTHGMPASPVEGAAGAAGGGAGATVRRSEVQREAGRVQEVWARHCVAGHLSWANDPVCRVCRGPVPSDGPELHVPRPTLGGVVLPDGQSVAIDRPLILGRAPRHPDSPLGESPHLVRIEDPRSEVSGQHLLIRPDLWSILVTDLGSTNGSEVVDPDGRRRKLVPHTEIEVSLGARVRLADVVEIRVEVLP